MGKHGKAPQNAATGTGDRRGVYMANIPPPGQLHGMGLERMTDLHQIGDLVQKNPLFAPHADRIMQAVNSATSAGDANGTTIFKFSARPGATELRIDQMHTKDRSEAERLANQPCEWAHESDSDDNESDGSKSNSASIECEEDREGGDGVHERTVDAQTHSTNRVSHAELLLGMHAPPKHPMFDIDSPEFVPTASTPGRTPGASGSALQKEGHYDPKIHMGNLAHLYMRRLNRTVTMKGGHIKLPEASLNVMMEHGFGRAPFLPCEERLAHPNADAPCGDLRGFCGAVSATLHRSWRKTNVVRLLSLLGQLGREVDKLHDCARPRVCTPVSLQGLYDSVVDRDAAYRKVNDPPPDPPNCRVFYDAINRPFHLLEHFVQLLRCLDETALDREDEPVHPLVPHVWELVQYAFGRTCERVGFDDWVNTCYALVAYDFVSLIILNLGTEALYADAFEGLKRDAPKYERSSIPADESYGTGGGARGEAEGENERSDDGAQGAVGGSEFAFNAALERTTNGVVYCDGAVVSVIEPTALETYRAMRMRACDRREQYLAYLPVCCDHSKPTTTPITTTTNGASASTGTHGTHRRPQRDAWASCGSDRFGLQVAAHEEEDERRHEEATKRFWKHSATLVRPLVTLSDGWPLCGPAEGTSGAAGAD